MKNKKKKINNKKIENKFYIIPQTEEEIERNRKMIETLRRNGLLQKHEKTFHISNDGNITKEN